MRNEDKVGRFNRDLDALLRGEPPDGDDALLDLARTLAHTDLGPRSRRRLETRRRFQFRPSPVLPRREAWIWRFLALVQTGPAAGLVASVLVFVLLSSFVRMASLPGRAAWSPASGAATTAALSAGSRNAILAPQPIPTPNAPFEVASTVPVVQTELPTTRLSPTQTYTRLAPQPSAQLDNKP